ncbi:MAG: hypothetical protein ABIY70_24755 [Capsulimonas sp.]|uniref:hypothetical protein n=1 Tax=Capsulimonas sp. TaxID=2494211 RepID=UPI0032646FA0
MATKQKREVIPGEVKIAKAARISVPYLRRIWRHGGGGPMLVEKLGRITGYSENLFIFGTKRAMGRLAEEAKQTETTATAAPTARA